ncbi:MAG: tRNA epoxyqueuosine(34) reductase QueG [Chthonomonas sp.]|nr:tRNA epoxyqueuosine(34) reductase QueG [Chthonomonas sp.]
MREEIRAAATALGFDQCGFAAITEPESLPALDAWLAAGFHGSMRYMADRRDLRADPTALLSGAKTAIMVALNYNQAPLPQVKIARYALGRDYHKVIRGKLRRLVTALDTMHPGHEHRPVVDSAPFLEREFAHRAGLGWFGKNTMLIDSRRGSWFFIGALLTTLEIEPDPPSIGGCGSCRACIDACPTGAIVQLQERWQVDARRCISYQTIEHRGELEVDTNGWVFGCDVCQEVCPFNEPRATQPLRAQPTQEPDFAAREWPDPKAIASLEAAEWDQLTLGSAVRRTGFDGLRRNARAASLHSPDDPHRQQADRSADGPAE